MPPQISARAVTESYSGPLIPDSVTCTLTGERTGVIGENGQLPPHHTVQQAIDDALSAHRHRPPGAARSLHGPTHTTRHQEATRMTDTPENTPAQDEAKRKFQEALERKARASRSQQAHQDGRLKIKGLNGPKGQNRNFRRKSG